MNAKVLVLTLAALGLTAAAACSESHVPRRIDRAAVVTQDSNPGPTFSRQ